MKGKFAGWMLSKLIPANETFELMLYRKKGDNKKFVGRLELDSNNLKELMAASEERSESD